MPHAIEERNLGMTFQHGLSFGSALTVLVLHCFASMAIGEPSTVARGSDDEPFATTRETSIRMGSNLTIVRINHRPTTPNTTAGSLVSYPFPRPRLAGFSPLIAIATSSKHSPDDIDYEHDLESSYNCNAYGPPFGGVCGSLNPPADRNFVVGILDSGSVADLAAGTGAQTLGLVGQNLTINVQPIGGVGGTVEARVTQPVGIYAAGLSAVDAGGTLNMNALVGHSNVAGLAAPPINCGGTELVRAFVGTPFLAFYTSVIRVDTRRTVTVAGRTYSSPDVQIQSPLHSIPEYSHAFSMELGSGGLPVQTASYYPDTELDPEDPGYLITPAVPTALSLLPLIPPTGGLFFRDVLAVRGEPGPTNLPITMHLMVDTGSEASIISEAMAADLNLPLTPDFTIDACGVGGIIEDIPGYYIDFVQINAFGGALKFSRAPFVVLDLPVTQLGTLDGVLGMNFFWNRNVIFEPSLIQSSFFHVSDPIPVAFADSDVDFHVDATDASFFISCITGPESAGVSPECDHLDVNFNGSIDLYDIAKFQICYSGSEQLANPDCGN